MPNIIFYSHTISLDQWEYNKQPFIQQIFTEHLFMCQVLYLSLGDISK
jgi:transglutaminase/protease-like cytokinesis protein 3